MKASQFVSLAFHDGAEAELLENKANLVPVPR